MGVKFTNNADTTLASNITNSATSVSVASSSLFPTLGAGEYFYATVDDGTNNEIVKVTAISGTDWTVVRAQDNSTARAFTSGDTVQLRVAAALLTDIQENIAAKSANQTVYSATTASSATAYNVGINPGVEANASVFLDGVYQHHDTFSFSGSTLTFDAAPIDGTKLEVLVDNLVNLQSSNLTVDTFTASSNQTAFTLSDVPTSENNLMVFIEGVFQNQDSYSFSSTTLTLDTGVTSGRKVVVYVINPVNIGTPSDGTITSAKLSGNLTTPGTLTVGAYDVAFDSPTFFVDNSNSRVGLGTATPSVPVDVVGDVKMSANLTVDTTTLVVDSSNNRVGIGTASPGYPLHVAQSVNGDWMGKIQNTHATNGYGLIIFAGDDSAVESFKVGNHNGSSNYFIVHGDGNVTMDSVKLKFNNDSGNTGSIFNNSGAAGDTRISGGSASDNGANIVMYGGSHSATPNVTLFRDGSTTNMTIDASGNVGIGTTSPASYFSTNLVISTADLGGITLAASATSATNYLMFADGTTGNERYRGYVVYGHTNDVMAFATAGATRMTITSAGDVGIGTASPDTTLQVGDNGSAGGAVKIYGVTNGNPLTIYEDSDNSITHNFHLDSSDNAGVIVYANGASAKVSLQTAGDSYFTGGIVGIGTTAPSTKLTVVGGARFDDNWITITKSDSGSYNWRLLPNNHVGGDLTLQVTASTNTNYATQASDYATKVSFLQNGNVGIGDTNPDEAKLSIDSVASGDYGIKVVQPQARHGIHIDQNGDADGLYIDCEAASYPGIEVLSKYGIQSFQDVAGGYAGYFTRSIAEAGSYPLVQMKCDNAANTQPVLQIYQDGAGKGLNIDQNGNGSALYIDSEATSASSIVILDAATTGHIVEIADADALTTGSIMRLSSDSSDTNTRNLMSITNDNALATGTTVLNVRNDSTGPLATFLGSGGVSIGTSSHNGPFYIKQPGADAYGMVTEASANDRWIRIGHNGTVGQIHTTYLSSGGASDLWLGTQGNFSALVIDTDGKVGIGTTTPGASLDVKHISGDKILRLGRPGTCDWDFEIGSSAHITNGSQGDLELIPQNGNMGFAVGRSGSSAINMRVRDGNMVLGGGIAFNSDTAAANHLDDYEEGDWTPVWVSAGGTIVTNTTYSVGRYIKIGKVVNLWWRLYTNDVTGPTGVVTISGLPFTIANNETQRGMALFALQAITGTLSGTPIVKIEKNTTTLLLLDKVWDSTEGTGDVGDHFDDDTWGYGSLTYESA